MRLANRTILITGASGGLGLVMADTFVAEGARVIAAARSADKLDALARKHPASILPLTLDVRDRAAVEDAFAALPDGWRAVDALIANAGLSRGLDIAPEASLDDWDEMVDTNIKGLMYCTRAILPGMVARGRGHIVTLGSVSGTYPYKGNNVYGGTKAFVQQFALNLKVELNGTPIRITNLEPGMVETDFSLVRFHGDEAKAAKVYENAAPLKPEDIAECAVFCLALPAHVNINRMEIMPTSQAPAGLMTHRST